MTGRLRNLADQATPPPWEHYDGPDDNWDEVVLDAFTPTGPYGFAATHDTPQAVTDARLMALAPDMARLLSDMAELLDRFQDARDPDYPDDETEALLARFRQLEERAG